MKKKRNLGRLLALLLGAVLLFSVAALAATSQAPAKVSDGQVGFTGGDTWQVTSTSIEGNGVILSGPGIPNGQTKNNYLVGQSDSAKISITTNREKDGDVAGWKVGIMVGQRDTLYVDKIEVATTAAAGKGRGAFEIWSTGKLVLRDGTVLSGSGDFNNTNLIDSHGPVEIRGGVGFKDLKNAVINIRSGAEIFIEKQNNIGKNGELTITNSSLILKGADLPVKNNSTLILDNSTLKLDDGKKVVVESGSTLKLVGDSPMPNALLKQGASLDLTESELYSFKPNGEYGNSIYAGNETVGNLTIEGPFTLKLQTMEVGSIPVGEAEEVKEVTFQEGGSVVLDAVPSFSGDHLFLQGLTGGTIQVTAEEVTLAPNGQYDFKDGAKLTLDGVNYLNYSDLPLGWGQTNIHLTLKNGAKCYRDVPFATNFLSLTVEGNSEYLDNSRYGASLLSGGTAVVKDSSKLSGSPITIQKDATLDLSETDYTFEDAKTRASFENGSNLKLKAYESVENPFYVTKDNSSQENPMIFTEEGLQIPETGQTSVSVTIDGKTVKVTALEFSVTAEKVTVKEEGWLKLEGLTHTYSNSSSSPLWFASKSNIIIAEDAGFICKNGNLDTVRFYSEGTLELSGTRLVYGSIDILGGSFVSSNGEYYRETIADAASYTGDNLDYVTLTVKAGETVDMSGVTATNSTITVEEGATLNISGSTLENSFIKVENATLNMEDSSVTGNKSGYVAVRADGSEVNLTNCSFKDMNHGNAEGGALRAMDGCTVTISGCQFQNNKAGRGGAVYTWNADVTIQDDTVFSGNQASVYGGALSFSGTNPEKKLTIDGVKFEDNTAGTWGGAICIGGDSWGYGTVFGEILAAEFAGNKVNAPSSEGGGGLFINQSAVVTMNQVAIYDNHAKAAGGGIYSCWVGAARAFSTEGMALFGNTADGAPNNPDIFIESVKLPHNNENNSEPQVIYERSFVEGVEDPLHHWHFGIMGDGSLRAKSNLAAEAQEKAKTDAAVLFHDNEAGHGGAIGLNGRLEMGSGTELKILKIWNDESDAAGVRPDFETLLEAITLDDGNGPLSLKEWDAKEGVDVFRLPAGETYWNPDITHADPSNTFTVDDDNWGILVTGLPEGTYTVGENSLPNYKLAGADEGLDNDKIEELDQPIGANILVNELTVEVSLVKVWLDEKDRTLRPQEDLLLENLYLLDEDGTYYGLLSEIRDEGFYEVEVLTGADAAAASPLGPVPLSNDDLLDEVYDRENGQWLLEDPESFWIIRIKGLPAGLEFYVLETALLEVEEEPIYESIFNNGRVLKNTVLIEMAVTKNWADEEDRDGVRPESIMVRLYEVDEDGTERNIYETAVLNEANGWTYKWEWSLPAYRADGSQIEYIVKEFTEDYEEGAAAGYTLTYGEVIVSEPGQRELELTNTHEAEKMLIPVTKNWDDMSDRDGLRPESITLVLLADGEEVDRVTLGGEGNSWYHTFTDLYVYHDGGIPIVYTIEELPVEGYETKIEVEAKEQIKGVCDGCSEKKFVITNTHTPETVDIPVLKVWKDGNNADQLRPDTVLVKLLADGKVAKSMLLSAANGWAYTFTDLPKMKDGAEVVYTVEEVAVDEYTSQIEQLNEEDIEAGFVVTNTHEPSVPVEYTEVKVDKVWKDENNKDGSRPDYVIVSLLADGKEVRREVLREGKGWSCVFTELPKFNEEGTEIVYTVEEEAVDGYTAQIEGDAKLGFIITNSHTPIPDMTKVVVRKHWVDEGHVSERPEKVTIRLLANGKEVGSLTLNETNQWHGTFGPLPVKDENGQEILYTVQEDPVEGYSGELSSESACCGECVNLFTNTYIPKPEEPTEPTTPEEPTTEEPTKPEEPTTEEPTQPTTPEEPTTEAPTEPTKPAPTEPTTPAPTEPTKPAPTEPTKPAPTEPSKPSPTQPTKPAKPAPDTGDHSNLGLYLGLLGAAAAGTGAILVFGRKKKED